MLSNDIPNCTFGLHNNQLDFVVCQREGYQSDILQKRRCSKWPTDWLLLQLTNDKWMVYVFMLCAKAIIWVVHSTSVYGMWDNKIASRVFRDNYNDIQTQYKKYDCSYLCIELNTLLCLIVNKKLCPRMMVRRVSQWVARVKVVHQHYLQDL